MLDISGQIAVAQLVFFLLAIFVVLHNVIQHGRHGLLGWLFLLAFCVLRVVGAAIVVNSESNDRPVSTAGLIISSIAISPLVVGIAGVAHESFSTIKSHSPFFFGKGWQALNHLACAAAIALLAIGNSHLDPNTNDTNKIHTAIGEIRGGTIVLLVLWVALGSIILISLRHHRESHGELQLAIGVTAALVPLLLRILYPLLGAFINSAAYNPSNGGPTAVKIVLSVVSEFLVVALLAAVGVVSRNMAKDRARDGGISA